jgi:ABC-type phosphate transport system auxiliary subunit
MKKIVLISILLSSASYSNEMQFQFKSPAFNGVGYSSHVLTIENLEQTRRQKQIDDKKAEAAKAAADAKNTNLAKFLNNLESRIYATLSQKIAEQLFKQDGNTSGTFDVAGSHIEWYSDGSNVNLKITDSAGSTTEISVPYGSLAW